MCTTAIQPIQETHYCSEIVLVPTKYQFSIKLSSPYKLVEYQKSFREYLSEEIEGKGDKVYYSTRYLSLEFECEPSVFLQILGDIEPNRYTGIRTNRQTGVKSLNLVFTIDSYEVVKWIRSRFIGLKENYDNIEVLAGDRILLDKSAKLKFSPIDHLAFFVSFCYYSRHCT
ncbi:hypothetical protein PCC7424_5501 (plasmid) [Gloeothece citriformis PCC 7424]|uniref:Uncharacterized protein n=1 Tax=Gloeothece citriformis (strain PCC 7424) TaxID=65393 RepID=B7KMP8_GLOC7|nr:hypothetical protein [Gloeothece citriformis]ACK74070.1 hypothetical protein PCC7424_5501 [Gloeothece citriformis PCC 7424]